jgi:hypothetical protein
MLRHARGVTQTARQQTSPRLASTFLPHINRVLVTFQPFRQTVDLHQKIQRAFVEFRLNTSDKAIIARALIGAMPHKSRIKAEYK